jgi:myosin-3
LWAERKVAIKILENLTETGEEAEEELVVLKDLSLHPNLPYFFGLFYKPCPKPQDSQLWFVMEVRCL